MKQFLIVLLILANSTTSGEVFECVEYNIPQTIGIRGHYGYHRQNLSSNVNKGDIVSKFFKAAFSPPDTSHVLKFSTTLAEPFVFVLNDAEGFSIWGPLYSMLTEVAESLNSTLEGLSVLDMNDLSATIDFRPDLILAPLFPSFRLATAVIDDRHPIYRAMSLLGMRNVLSRAVAFGQIDCILFRKEFWPKSFFDFANIFDFDVAMAFLASIPVVSFFLAEARWRRFRHCLLVVCEHLAGLERHFNSRFLYLFLLFETTYWLLQELFGGDMVGLMAQPPEPKVIDSWQDLKMSPHLKILALTDFGEDDLAVTMHNQEVVDQSKSSYFSKNSPFYADFTARTKLESGMKLQGATRISMDDGEVLDLSTFDGDTVLMCMCDIIKYRKFNSYCGKLRAKTHVSSTGGDILPYFFLVTCFARDVEVGGINTM